MINLEFDSNIGPLKLLFETGVMKKTNRWVFSSLVTPPSLYALSTLPAVAPYAFVLPALLALPLSDFVYCQWRNIV